MIVVVVLSAKPTARPQPHIIMQLREYVLILRRFWPILLLLPALAAGLSLAMGLRQPARYQAAARLMITQSPLAPAGNELPDYNNSYSWLTSEYILDDLPQVVGSRAFAEDVAAALAAEGLAVDPAAVQGGLRAEVLHRAASFTAVADRPELATAFLRGAIAALQTNGLSYWNRAPSGGGGLQVAVIDPPGAAAPVGGLRALLLEVALRGALAAAAAVGLALLLHYLDDRLRSPRQAEQWTGLSVIAVIPKE